VLVVLRSQVIAPILNPNAGFDLLRDFEPVMLVAHQRLALVIAPSLPVTSVRGLVRLSRATPGTLDYGSANASFRLSTEALLRHTGARMHRIPYGGSPQVLRALMVGEVQVALLNASILGEAVRDGRVRALAVIAPARSPDLPDVPTLAEAGYPGFDLPFWVGVAVPARTPEPIVAALNRAITRAMARPSARARIAATGYEPDPDTPAAFGARLARESAESAEILRGIDPASR
jgi:tripartite-type tricarboxylate transporter receptor subunit TctC